MGQVHSPQALVGDIEGVGVLHHEFAAAKDAGPRPGLVAVLGLNLEQQRREVLVGTALPFDRQGEQLLMSGSQQVVVVAAILEPEHAVAVLGPAIGGLVGRAWQQRGEEDLLAADRDHLLAHDVLDFAQHPKAQRQPAVQAGPDRADVAGPDQQFVAGHLGVGRVVTQRMEEQLGHAGDHSPQA